MGIFTEKSDKYIKEVIESHKQNKPKSVQIRLMKTREIKEEKMVDESGHGLVWCEFVERGCPAKKEEYFLTEKELLALDIVKQAIDKAVEEERERVLKLAKRAVRDAFVETFREE